MFLTKQELHHILESIGEFKLRLLFFFLLSIPVGLIKAAQAYLVKPLFDTSFSTHGDASYLKEIIIYIVLIGIGNYIFRYWSEFGIKSTTTRMSESLTNKMINKYVKADYFQLRQTSLGDLLNIIIFDIPIYTNVSKELFSLIKEFITIIALIFLLIYQSSKLSLFILLVLPIYAFFIQILNKKVKEAGHSVRDTFSRLTSINEHAISHQKTIRGMNLSEFHFNRFKDTQAHHLKKFKKLTLWQEVNNPTIELLGVLFFSIVFYFGALEIKSGDMTSGSLISFLTAAVLVVDPLKKFSRSLGLFKAWSISGHKVFHILSLDEERSEINSKSIQHDISFEQATLQIEGNNIFKNIDLDLDKKRIGIVGESGSGKSTLLKSILNLTPKLNSGKISFHSQLGKNLIELRNHVAYVSQDPYLFNETFLYNITLGEKVDEALLNFALKTSLVSDFIDDIDNGLEAIIGDNGLALSKGQAQRVCLARAIYSKKPYIFLDEATSALDNNLEQRISENLVEINRKIICITHRVKSLKNFDEIIFMNQGEIYKRGTYEDLLSDPKFQSLIN